MRDAAFIRQVAKRLRCDERRAEALVLVVLQELHNRLTPKEAEDVAAQLPNRLKRMWCEEDQPGRRIRRVREQEFVGDVRKRAVLPDDREAERTVRAVFGTLQILLGSPTGLEGEAWHVFSQLPKDLKRLWVESSRDQQR